MKPLTGRKRSLYEAIKNGSPTGKLVVVNKARYPLPLARALERRGFITVSRWDKDVYLAKITGKDPDAPPPEPAKVGTARKTLKPNSKAFPEKIRERYPDAVKYRHYSTGIKTVEIPVGAQRRKDHENFYNSNRGNRLSNPDQSVKQKEVL